ncbi:hypothetical protein ALC57_16474 [Trachymyrmex cornetzi]|uniref:Mutator-like transposase domain-containing protein n=1 Tax=Trachymyrmex cornetzi TaxID=471704 RepID=A0A151IV47_9HYME|nr:hypothetical protein ALC57_16474 [Trachymyrmex cornetzi]
MDRKGKKRQTKSPGDSAKKRKFRGNQHTSELCTDFVSTSANKLKNQDDFEPAIDESSTYVVLCFSLVFTALQSVLQCKVCNSGIQFLKQSQVGLEFTLCIKCKCDEMFTVHSCPKLRNAYEINRRFTYAMRLLGVGLAGINLFCSLMDLGTGLNKNGYYNILQNKKNTENGNYENEITVSGDGSWAKRGFTSLLGLVSLVGKYSNKVVDVTVKSKVCKACEKWVGKEETDDYLEWYENHKDKCTANHEGSSGKMEVDGVIDMFKRSIEWFDVKYKRYVGDGDSKTFKNLLDADIYNGEPVVEKSECVLHVKKRMYRQNSEAPKVKNLVLTNKLMIQLGVYYRLAIMRNENSVDEIKKAMWATYYHLISTDEKPQHSYCPEGLDSWCKYQKCKAENKEETFIHPPAFNKDTAILKPIYEELSSDDLLKRCLDRNTQNNNEAFNHCVWNLAPKHIFIGQKTLEIAAWTAAYTFNESFLSVLKIMETMGVTIGPHARAYANMYNNSRISTAEKNAAFTSKEARIARRSQKVAQNDDYEETEGLLYAPGIAD